jgi:flagellar M-ring protein FliF
MSIAVVVNRERLATILGADATPEKIAERVAEIQALVTSATGYSEARGDTINVSAVEFIDGLDGVEIEEPSMLAAVGSQAGTMINAAAFIVVVFLVAFFGLRPMVAALARPASPAVAGPSFEDVQRSLPGPESAPVEAQPALPGARMAPTPLDELRQKIRPAPQDRLARMVDLNEERTALILRKWAHQEAAA